MKNKKQKQTPVRKKGKESGPVSRSGRFRSGPGKAVSAFTESISFDRRLWKQDILGSMAHATMLGECGLMTASEVKKVVSELENIGDEISRDAFEWSRDLEDIHMNIEATLSRRVPAGAKLHTGRSRNDQVALDLRMWMRDEIIEVTRGIQGLQAALVDLGERYAGAVIPGYTHLQRAQPVYFAHHLLAYAEMLERDRTRLVDCFQRVNVCPLGSGALAGSSLPLDRARVATLLGFTDSRGRPILSQNSMDAVSDRDFVIEFCAAGALIGVHLSRLAEDWILWVSEEFRFIRIADAYTTGSSLMPQKKNPDLAELTRGKSGRLIGNLTALLTVLKGLPMTYNRDLQEDKEPLFDTADTLRACLGIMAEMICHTDLNLGVAARAASDPALMATELADYLVRKGAPFREAHHAVGALVGLAESAGKPLNGLSVEEYRSVDERFDADVMKAFDVHAALALRDRTGCPGPREVRLQIRRWKRRLSE